MYRGHSSVTSLVLFRTAVLLPVGWGVEGDSRVGDTLFGGNDVTVNLAGLMLLAGLKAVKSVTVAISVALRLQCLTVAGASNFFTYVSMWCTLFISHKRFPRRVSTLTTYLQALYLQTNTKVNTKFTFWETIQGTFARVLHFWLDCLEYCNFCHKQQFTPREWQLLLESYWCFQKQCHITGTIVRLVCTYKCTSAATTFE